MKGFRVRGVFLFSVSILLAATSTGQVLETETARFLPQGSFKFGSAYEFQRSREGTERAVPFLIEYGITDSLEIAIEPVAYTAIQPKVGGSANGIGDVEATLGYRFRPEADGWPALAAAFEVKFPTARNTAIGTGRTDFTGYLVASKRVGIIDLHAHVGYAALGSPAGQHLSNVFHGGIAAVYRTSERYELFAELLGSTSSTSSEGDAASNPGTPGGSSPEAPNGELFGTIGVGTFVTPRILVFASGTYDNRNAFLARVGFTVGF